MSSLAEEQFEGGDSFPKDFGYGSFDEEKSGPQLQNGKTRILLMGLRRSGKTSIQKVVFQKMSPNETLFLEGTNKMTKEDIANSSFLQYQLWDCPGQMDFQDFDAELIFARCGALIFVIDAQDDYMEALNTLNLVVIKAYNVNKNIRFEVFVHKVDGLYEDNKMETQRDIHQRSNDDLLDAGYDQITLSFHLTSIYDHSIFEAFSKVIQKLIPQLPTLENLLNILINNSGIEKAFLFDVVSKIYIATDSSPVDMQSYELCCDMVDLVIDVSGIYGLEESPDVPAFDSRSSSLIKLNSGTILYLREVDKYLALVCILREDNFEKQGVINYNFLCFREALQQVFEIRNKALAAESSSDTESIDKVATNTIATTWTLTAIESWCCLNTWATSYVTNKILTNTEKRGCDFKFGTFPIQVGVHNGASTLALPDPKRK